MEGTILVSQSRALDIAQQPQYRQQTGADQRFTIVIAHAHPIVNAGLAALLATDALTEIKRVEAGDVDKYPDASVIVADYATSLSYLARRKSGRGPRVVIVAMRTKEWEVNEALSAGAYGYLLQDSPAEQVIAAVQQTRQGLRYLSEAVNQCLIDSVSRVSLTGRENDVLKLMAQGQCNKTIARHLGIGVGTVKTHIKGVFDKLGATARTHAVVLATRRGLVSVDITACGE